MNEAAEFGAGFGVDIRLEVHGAGTNELPNIKKIMEVADAPGVGVCWNCNPTDLAGAGLKANFNMVKDRLGATVHIHDLRSDAYPWADFFELLRGAKYEGWTLIEEGKVPDDVVAAMKANVPIFKKLSGQG